MRITHSNLTLLGSLNRIQKRNLIELYCNVANILPVHERMLFHLYYRNGYSTVEISQLLMIHNTTVGRRLMKIATKLTDLISGENLEKQADSQSPQSTC